MNAQQISAQCRQIIAAANAPVGNWHYNILIHFGMSARQMKVGSANFADFPQNWWPW